MFKKSKKKRLSDKAKLERKQKIKHIVKIVLDVIVYGFALFMVFGLVLGSCSKPKTASAYYHTDYGYSSIADVNASMGQSSRLRYYYDINYPKTFPNYATFRAVFPETGNYVYVNLVDPYVIDGHELVELALLHPTNSFYTIQLCDERGDITEDIISVSTTGISVIRSDLLVGLFSGNYSVTPPNVVNINVRWFQFLTYYFGEYGYSRISYNFNINVNAYNYFFVDTIEENPTLYNGLFFKNDNFPTLEPTDIGQSYLVDMFVGSFRCNGVFYDTITYKFSSVYGKMFGEDVYYIPVSGSQDPIDSSDETFLGYWYLDSIIYSRDNVSLVVWNNGYWQRYNEATLTGWAYTFADSWVGDTAYSLSPYRDIFIYYALDSISGAIHSPFLGLFSQLEYSNYAQFLNYFGEAYPNPIQYGGVTDDSNFITSIFGWVRSGLTGLMPMLSYSLIPGITIGTLIMIPITMSILLWVINLFKR